jgi:hypothetical protein
LATRSASTPSRSTWRRKAAAGGQVTVGQQVGQNLYLKVEQIIGQQAQTIFHRRVRAHQVARFRTKNRPGLPSHSRRCSRRWRPAASICSSSSVTENAIE